MQDWVVERLGKVVGKKDRKGLPDLAARNVECREFDTGDYYRVSRNEGCLPKGMVITDEGVIPDYPRVRRIFNLKNFITRYYYSPFYAEELVPGYHARFVRVGDRTLAFTRDGRWCPFTTDRVSDLLPSGILDDHPDLIVCLVINGSGIPYITEPAAGQKDEISATAVDFLERDVREPLSPEEKYPLFDQYGMPCVEHIGPFDPKELDGLDEWVAGIIARKGTGVVLKPSERPHRPLQYSTTPEVLRAHPLWMALADDDSGFDSYFQRLLRTSCALMEEGAEPEAIDWEAVGRSLLQPIVEGVQRVGAGEDLRESFNVWVHQKETAEALLPHMAEGEPSVIFEEKALSAENGGWRLVFDRIYRGASDTLARRIGGASYLR